MGQLKRIIIVTALPIACISCGSDQSGTPAGSNTTPSSPSPTTTSPSPTTTSPSPPATPSGSTRVNDTDSSIIYSRGNSSTKDWSNFQPAPEDYQQDEHSSNFVRNGGAVTGVGAVINFSGTGMTWIGKKGPQYGIASYSVDGGPAQTVDNYNSTEIDQKPVLTVSGLSSESHVLSISLLNQKNAAAVDYWQTLDAFDINGSPLAAAQGTSAGYNSSELTITGKWGGALVSDGSDLSGGHYWSNETNASISWTFVGSLIEVFGRPDYEDGYMDVYIDSASTPVASINGHWGLTDDDTLNSSMLYAKKVAAGQHTIKVVVAGKRDSTSRDNYVQIDEFIAFQ